MPGSRVVIIGGGFGGLAAVKGLRGTGLAVTLVDRNNFHTFQPLLYQVATAGLDSENIAATLRGVVGGDPGVDVRCAEVESVDLDRRVVHAGHVDLEYDWLVVAAGAVSSSFGVPGVAEHALCLKTLTDAIRLRAHILRQFEDAAADPAAVDDGALTFVVVGGGPTGVELSGALLELLHVLAKDFPRLDFKRTRVLLLEATSALLPTFSLPSRRLALDTLRSRGAEVHLDAPVDRLDPGRVHLKDGSTIETRTVIWVAGIRPSPLAERVAAPRSADGRIEVEPTLRVAAHPEVFVIGDLASGWPQLAPVAMQQGRHAAREIRRERSGRRPRPFRYRDKGTMATIGRGSAVAELPLGVHFGGLAAWVLWLVLHLLTLVGFRNRAAVLVDWSWNYLTYDRGARLILDDSR